MYRLGLKCIPQVHLLGLQCDAALTLVLLNSDLSVFENTADPDQLASDKAI